MSRVIRAVIVERPGSIKYEQIELDEPRAGEVEVQIVAAGVCGSDLHVFRGDWQVRYPMVMGHEGSGYVTQVGPEVEGLRVGDAVVLSWNAPCRQCRLCRSGKPYACSLALAQLDRGGTLFDGTTRFHRGKERVHHYLGVSSWSEYAVVPASGAVRVPQGLDLAEAALAGCALPTGVGAILNTAALSRGANVLVIGCGGVGLCGVQGARLAGAGMIVAIDRDEARLGLARRLGADVTHGGADTVEEALTKAYPEGFDVVVDAVGSIATLEMGLRLLGPGGALVIVGLTPEGSVLHVDPLVLAMSNQRILGSNYGSIDPAVDIKRILEDMHRGEIQAAPLVSARWKLSEAERALSDLANGVALRQLLIP